MTTRKLLCLIALLYANAWHTFGQRAENWRVYRASDGLPQTFVSAIGSGARGRLWTRHPGLEWIGRLDGYEIQVIPAPDSGDSHIYESGSGQIWTLSSGTLMEYRRDIGWKKFNVPEIAAGLVRNRISMVYPIPLFPLRQNHVLLVMPDALLECNIEDAEHPQTLILRSANQTGLQSFSSITTTADGNIWITGKSGLMKASAFARNLNSDTEWHEFLFDPQLKLRRLRQAVDDNAGGIVAVAEPLEGTNSFVARFNGGQWNFMPAGVQKIIQAWREADSTYWAMTPTALLQKKPGEQKFSPYEGITPHRFFDFAMETNGVFWISTSDGLYRYAPLAWRSPPNIPENNMAMLGITEDANDTLWFASVKSLLSFQNEKWTEFPLPSGISSETTDERALFVLTNGIVTLGIDGSLFSFHPASREFRNEEINSTIHHQSLGLLRDGTLCVQTLSAGKIGGPLEIYGGSGFIPLPVPQPEIEATNNFLFLNTSPNGTLSLGYTTGLAVYTKDHWENFALPPHLNFTASTRMIEINEGRFWFGLENRILEFDGKNWNFVRSGFDGINSLIKGRDGSIWVGMDNGLQRSYRGIWLANNTEQGLPATEIRQVYEDRHGRIWAGTLHGLAQYHPEADIDPPRTYVQNLPGQNNSAPEGSIVNLTFSGRDKWKYTPEESLLYSYRVDGQEWSAYQEQRSVTLLDMPAGAHSLRVRSMDRNWNVDPTSATLQFKITVPWYRESRLMLAYSAGFALALFFAGLAFNRHRQLVKSYAEVEAKVALRTRQLELANQELFHSQKMNALGTLAAGIAHDFNNILSIIKGSAQIIEDNLDNQTKVRTRADRIKTVVEQGAGIVKAMLGFSRGSERHLTMCDVAAIVHETIVLLGDRFLREVEVQVEPPASKLPLVPASKDFLQQILLNFIFNASEATTGRQKIILRTIQAKQLPPTMALKPPSASSYVFIYVQDFGSGIPLEVMPRIFEPFFTTKSLSARRGTGLGLSMVYELARQMDCGLSVESVVGRGSMFAIIIPARDLPLESSPISS